MCDDLFEKDPKMREIIERSRAEGLAESRAEGKVRGEIRGLQHAIVIIVQARFPTLAELAAQNVTQVNEVSLLLYLVEALATISDETIIRWLIRKMAA
nr:hypothetical protein [Ktedonobacteraceae bacterium]